MIIFVVTGEHAYTHQSLIGADPALDVKILRYAEIPVQGTIPRATYILTDLDRLTTEMLRTAASLYRQLRDNGVRVLNDPARFLSRSGLLRVLFKKGFNQFNAYRVEEQTAPARWPVFLRTEGDHIGPLSGLLHDPAELEAAVARAVAAGIPISKMLIVEFMAEPVRPGLYRKLSCFRIGDAKLGYICGHDTHWVVKFGVKGIAPPELYDEELRMVTENPFGPIVDVAFDLGGIDYGRVDFSLAGGKVQVYEINSNPLMQFGGDHPSPARMESYRIFQQNYFAALRSIDTP